MLMIINLAYENFITVINPVATLAGYMENLDGWGQNETKKIDKKQTIKLQQKTIARNDRLKIVFSTASNLREGQVLRENEDPVKSRNTEKRKLNFVRISVAFGGFIPGNK